MNNSVGVRIATALHFFAVLALFLYSFTQVDLGLTIMRWKFWQGIQQSFQAIGYFNRPLSTLMYILIVFLLFVSYLFFLFLIFKKKVSPSYMWKVIGCTTVVLIFSYNAFSYDLFNYIFDAKIVTYYQQNPYEHKALDYPKDPMLAFMHWTHRVYPYGPSWLVITVPLSFAGMQFFLPTIIIFKALAAASFVGTTYYIGKLITKFNSPFALFGITFFALNPLVVIESLVSAHNDIIMMFFSIVALYMLFSKKYIFSIALFFISVGVKYATAFLLPAFIVFSFFNKSSGGQQRRHIELVFFLTAVLMIVPVLLAVNREHNFQPWYILYVFPFAALIARKYYVFIPAVIFSFFSLLVYAPFLYFGNWDFPVNFLTSIFIMAAIVCSLILVLILSIIGIFIHKSAFADKLSLMLE